MAPPAGPPLRKNPAFWLLGGAVVATIAQAAAYARERRRRRKR